LTTPRRFTGVTWAGLIAALVAFVGLVAGVVWYLWPRLIVSAKQTAIASIDSRDLVTTIRQLKPQDLVTAASETLQGWVKNGAAE
jgi:hypothetical protein